MAARLGIGGGGDRARSQRKALLGEDDATMVFETSKEVRVVTTFDQMGLREDLLRGIYAYGRSREGSFLLLLQEPKIFSYRIREAVGHPAALHHTHCGRQGRHCTVRGLHF